MPTLKMPKHGLSMNDFKMHFYTRKIQHYPIPQVLLYT